MTTELLDRMLVAADPAAGVVARRDPEAILSDIFDTDSVPAPTVREHVAGTCGSAWSAAAAAAVVAIPSLSGTGNAYAGWTAYPAALSTGQTSAVAEQCQRWVHGSITQAPTQVVLSERRGDIGLTLLTGPKGLLVTCEQDLEGSGEPSGSTSEAYLTRTPLPTRFCPTAARASPKATASGSSASCPDWSVPTSLGSSSTPRSRATSSPP